MSVKLEDLKPQVMAAAVLALQELKQANFPVIVTYTLRTDAEQIALYAQGRKTLKEVNALRAVAGLYQIKEYLGKDKKTHSDNDYSVTNCDGVKNKSPHQGGTAIDVVPLVSGAAVWPSPSDPRWKGISDVFKKHGFEWGGDWHSFPDLPHYQMN